MTEDFIAFSTQALKDERFLRGNPALGEYLGLMTPKRMQEQVDIFLRLKTLSAPVPLERFVTFNFLPPAPSHN
jgi:NitT/TauT family transport system substrate-binding protein